MEQIKENIARFNKRATISIFSLCLARGVVLSFPVLLLGLLVLSGVDSAFELPVWVRQSSWGVLLTLTALRFAQGFWPITIFHIGEKTKNLYFQQKDKIRIGLLQVQLRRDEFRVALELAASAESEGISEALKNQFLSGFSQKLQGCSPKWCFPSWPWRQRLVLFFAVLLMCSSLWAFLPTYFPIHSRTFFPFSHGNMDQFLTVWPGDGEVPWGGKVDVKIGLLVRSLTKPVLYVKTKKDWLSVDATREFKDVQVYTFQNITEPLPYRVQWKKDWSRKFLIRPVKPIEIVEFEITLHKPSYLGGDAVKQTSPELTGLTGTAVSLKARASHALAEAKVLFSDGSEKAVTVKDNEILCDFALSQTGSYGFYLKTVQGLVLEERTRYPIHVIQDRIPTVSLLSPETDLILGEKERVPLTFQGEDDFGLKEAVLIWTNKEGEEKKRTVKTFSIIKDHVLETYNWDLGRENLNPGDLIRYSIELLDGNVVTGPGRARTEARYIEIASFEKGHEAIEEALEKWRDEVVDLLADVKTLGSKTQLESTDVQSLASEFNGVSQNSEQLEEVLKKLVSLMEADPLADYGVWLEHQQMAENMEAMNEGFMKTASAAFQTGNKKEATEAIENVSAELERMLALSESLSKNQRARDVVDYGNKLEDLSIDMAQRLEESQKQGKQGDKQLLSQIQDMVNEALDLMQSIAKSLKNFPDELPEDFVNQEALKNLDMDESHDILSQIQKALQAGDMSRALQLANQFRDMAKQMKDQLLEAHESFLNRHSAEELTKQISQHQKELEAVTQEERQILRETQELESKRLETVLEEQSKLLEKLAQLQLKALQKMELLLKKDIPYVNPKLVLGAQYKPMQDVAEELRAKRIEKSLLLLPSLIDRLKEAETLIQKENPNSELLGSVKEIAIDEESILSQLKKPGAEKAQFSEKDRQRLSQLKDKQKSVSEKTSKLKSGLQRLSQKTANIGVPLTQRLTQAISDMNQASGHLDRHDSKSAKRSEESALQNLQEAQSMLSEAQSALGKMAGEQMGEGSGRGGTLPRAMIRGHRQANQGEKTGHVKLPSAEDYRPPKAFREELLESLKEKFPIIYEDIIHKYFKRLSE